jgi:hypothetical protein
VIRHNIIFPASGCRFQFHFLHLFILLISILSTPAFSQEYFQQEVNINIDVKLDDKKHELNGFESVRYINNSPDTLLNLYFHLWPNAYSGNNTALARQLLNLKGKQKLFKDNELKGFIDSLDFRIDGFSVQWNLFHDHPDICTIWLNSPLKPNDTILITTPFRVKIPLGTTSRLGHIGESYQISQWFPKPAVYDINGWHHMPYLDQGEFYSEFGYYDVSITLPSNYVVGSTGNLQNGSEKEWLQDLAADTAWKKFPDIISHGFPETSDKYKTLRYTGHNIHDFAWFADKRFHVHTSEVQLPFSSRKVSTMVLFTNEQISLWKDALNYVNNSIIYFSQLIGDYPYDSFTAVQSTLSAGLGMEYPGITVIGRTRDAFELDEVISHEVCHSWFYAAIGSNERRFPYLDESIVSAFTTRYINEKYPEQKLWKLYFKNFKTAKFFGVEKMPETLVDDLDWLIHARGNLEQPINLTSQDFTSINYGLMLYYKAPLGFNYLEKYLGDSIYTKAMQQYYRAWKFRHPAPEDLQSEFESVSGRNLDWFFKDFIGTTKRLDYKILRSEGRQLLVKNNAELAVPLIISGIKKDTVVFEKWYEGFEGKKWIELPPGEYKEIIIDHNHVMPDLYRLNNNIRMSGILKKTDPLRIRFYFTIEDPDKRSLIYVPVLNWNREDGFMVGLAMNNGLILPKKIEYSILPFFSFKKPDIEGSSRISYNITPWNTILRLASFTVDGTKFGAPFQNYYTAKLRTDIYFRNYHEYKNHRIFGSYNLASDLQMIENGEKAAMKTFFQFGYNFTKTGLLNPVNFTSLIEFNSSFQKTTIDLNYKYDYYSSKSGLDIRLFTGMMLKNKAVSSFYALAPSGRSGRELYLYQGTYPDRFSHFTENFWSRQMTLSEGGLISPVNDSLGYNNFLISLTLSSTLPGPLAKLPVKPFINMLLGGANETKPSELFFEAGVKTGIWKIFEIYVPVLVSDNIGSVTGSFKDRIRFILNLETFLKVKLN